MDYMKIPVAKLIASYSIYRKGDKIGTRSAPKGPEFPAFRDALISRKAEIMDYFLAQDRAEEERRKRIESIPGLFDIKAHRAAVALYNQALSDCMESGKSIFDMPKPAPLDESKYPQAVAFLEAERFSLAANFRKAAAGEKAMTRILAGDDLDAVLKEMENWLPEEDVFD